MSGTASLEKPRKPAKTSSASILARKIDMAKVDRPVIEAWIIKKLDEYLPDDDIVTDFTLELLRAEQHPSSNQIKEHLQGFLGSNTKVFCVKLWELLETAQHDPNGIPPELVRLKQEELDKRVIRQGTGSSRPRRRSRSRSPTGYSRRDRSPDRSYRRRSRSPIDYSPRKRRDGDRNRDRARDRSPRRR